MLWSDLLKKVGIRSRASTAIGDDENHRFELKLPQKAHEDILAMRLMPTDDLTQVFKDAFRTHYQVVGALRSGGKIYVHRGAVVTPLNLDHLTTPEKNRASFEVIKGGADD